MTAKKLSPRELQILAMRARGVTQYAVGLELGITEQTVKHTMNRIYRKLEVDGLQAALVAIGWTVVPEPLS